MKKANEILFLMIACLFSISTKAELPIDFFHHSIYYEDNLEKDIELDHLKKFDIFFEKLQTQITSGQKEEISFAVKSLIKYLKSTKKDFLYPSVIKAEDFHQLLNKQILSDSARLIDIGKLYLISAKKNYKQLRTEVKRPTISSHSLKEHQTEQLEYIIKQKDKIETIQREWRMALAFFSLAGFDSSIGKNKYIQAFHEFQQFYESLFKIKKYLEPASQNISYLDNYNKSIKKNVMKEVIDGSYLRAVKDFYKFIEVLNQFYFSNVIPPFLNLSWINQDLQTRNQVGMFFEYGRILNTAFKNQKGLFYVQQESKGLDYIYKALDKNYFPAVKYLIEIYPQQTLREKNRIEAALKDYLKKENLTRFNKFYVTFQLMSLNMDKEKTIYASLKSGAVSLKESCQSLFKK